MNTKTAKQIVKGYKTKLILIGLAYALAVVACVLITLKFILPGIMLMLVLAVSLRMPFEKLREKEIESVIYDDLDPEKFNEIMGLGVLKNSNRHKLLYLASAGKHDEILALVKESEEKTMHPIDKCNNIYREGYVYFERGEYNKLPAVVNKYSKLKSDNPKIQYALNNFTVFDKYDAFADEDYEYVVDVCDIDLNAINPKTQNHKLTRINVGFYRAVSLYKLGRIDEAKKGFEEIIAFAPKMYKAKLSKDFLDLIEKE
jgi:tetratricopeptide (TPR) repeat protein